MGKRMFAAVGVALALSACATAKPPALAQTSYFASDCATAPDLSGALSLLPKKNRQVWTVDQAIDGTAPCLELDGAQGPYVVFALPENQWQAPIEVGSVLEGARIFSPHVILLDAQGQESRSFTPESYNFRSNGYGRTYSVQFMPQANERYVLVTSNPLRIGTSYQGINTGTSTTMIWTGYGAVNWTRGVEAFVSSGFSYDGVIRANVFRSEKED